MFEGFDWSNLLNFNPQTPGVQAPTGASGILDPLSKTPNLFQAPDPNMQFMTMPSPTPALGAPTAPLVPPHAQNLQGPVGGDATSFQLGDPAKMTQDPAVAGGPERKALGLDANQAALLAKLAGNGQTPEMARLPAGGGGGVARSQAPGMTSLGFGGFQAPNRPTLGSLLYGRK